MSRGRVAIVYPRSNIDSVPALTGAIDLLAQHAFEVDVLTLTLANQAAPRFASARVSLHSLGIDGLAQQPVSGLRSAARRLGFLPRAARAPLARCYSAAAASLAHGSRIVARARRQVAARNAGYDCLIGVDPDGLLLAHSLSGGAPVAYYSLELLLSDELRTPSERQLKAREQVLSRAAPFVIVQDEERGRLLAEDNGLDWQRLVFVPNSPPGPARRRPTRYWHARFSLPHTARVVLHAGSLGDWTGIQDLVEAAADWPPDWVLVVHTRYDAAGTPYLEDLQGRADPGRVRFSLQPVARQEYDRLVDGADVGLAFYVPVADSSFTGRNLETIGLSSGKLAYFLRAGLPVIVNEATSIASSVHAAGCGVVVPGAAAVGAALELLDGDYEAYSRRACEFFDRELDFARAFGGVIARLDSLRRVAA
jgi:glycosyltransferase involved in cell wall biosynthesis